MKTHFEGLGAARRMLTGLLLVVAATGVAHAAGSGTARGGNASAPARELRWEELVPKGWDPFKLMPNIGNGLIQDGSAQALQQMRDMRRIWDEAPTNTTLDGQFVKLPGYVVPVEQSREGLKEFLLVPYFGACIHSPPPPANQIVHVVLEKPVKGIASMSTVWVTGTMSQARLDSGMGVSGYKMTSSSVARYVGPAR